MSSSYNLGGQTKPVTVPWVLSQKGLSKLTMLTAYDYPTARLVEDAGVEMILVGDSMATVLRGEIDTTSLTIDEMLPHVRAVTKATSRALVIADMPFLSYQVSTELAVTNAGRFIKEARAQAVKLEGGVEFAEVVRALSRASIPVVGHIGLTPQSIHMTGAYRTHGKSEAERRYLLESAKSLSDAGAFCLVLECVEATLAADITRSIAIPTIGIGSGVACDGQVLVTQDLVGLTLGKVPKFVSPLADLKVPFAAALRGYVERTKNSGARESAEVPCSLQ